MAPPFDALAPLSQPLDPDEEFRQRMLGSYRAKFGSSETVQPQAYTPLTSAAGPTAGAIPTDPEASPPLVPDSTVRPQPYARPREVTGTPGAAFATKPVEQRLPGVTQLRPTGPQDVSADAAAALMARATETHGELDIDRRGGAEGLSRQPTPGQPFGLSQEQMAIPPGIEPEDEDGYWERLGRGLMERGGNYAAGFTQVFSDVIQTGARAFTEDSLPNYALQGASDLLQSTGDLLDGIQSESYKPKYNDVSEALRQAKQGNFGYMLGYMAEQTPLAIADAAFSFAGAPIYLTATAGDFAKEHAENDGRTREQLTAKDYAYGSAAAVVSLVFDKMLIGTGKPIVRELFGPEMVKEIAEFGSSNVFKRIAKSGVRGAAVESSEEAAQETLTTVDTEKGWSGTGTALAAVGGALAGAPAAVGIDVFRPRSQQQPAEGSEYERLFREGQRLQLAIDQAVERGAPEAEIKALQDQLDVIIKSGDALNKKDVSADAAAAITAAAPGAVQGPPVPEMPPMQGPQQPPVQGPPAPEAPPVQGPPIPEMPPVQGPQQPPLVEEQAIPTGEEVTEEEAAPFDAAGFVAATGQQPARTTPTGDIEAPSRSDREIRETYAPDKPKRLEGESDAVYQARLEGWNRAIEEHEARLKEQDEESWKLQNQAEDAIIKEYRKSRALPTSAAARLLQNLKPEGAVDDGGEVDKQARVEREALTNFYRNLSNAARIAGDAVEADESMKPAQRQALKRRMLQAATWMANASANVQDFVLSEYKGTGSPKEGKSPFDRAYASFRLIDPLLLQMLGVEPDHFRVALSHDKIQPLVTMINDISKRAYSRVQKYEAGEVKAGKAREEDTGRVELPALPKQGKRQHQVRHLTESQTKGLRDAARSRSPSKVQEAIQNITFQTEIGGRRPPKKPPPAKMKISHRWWKTKTAIWAEIDEILSEFADVAPEGLHPPRESEAKATSETLYRDERYEIQNEEGHWVRNPNFGKRLKNLGPEQKAEIKQLQAEEARFLKGKVGFLDPDKVVTAKGSTGQVNVEKLSRRAEEAEDASIKAYNSYVAAQEVFNEAQQAVVDARKGTDLGVLRDAVAALQMAWGVRQQAGQEWLKASQAAQQASLAAEERHPRAAADVAAELEAQAESARTTVIAAEWLVNDLGGVAVPRRQKLEALPGKKIHPVLGITLPRPPAVVKNMFKPTGEMIRVPGNIIHMTEATAKATAKRDINQAQRYIDEVQEAYLKHLQRVHVAWNRLKLAEQAEPPVSMEAPSRAHDNLIAAREAYKQLGGDPDADTRLDDIGHRIMDQAQIARDEAEYRAEQVEAYAMRRVQMARAWTMLNDAKKAAASAATAATQARKEADRLSGKPMRWTFRNKRKVAKEIQNLRTGRAVQETGKLSTLEAAIHYEPVTVMKKGLNDKAERVFKEVVLHPTKIILGKPFAISEAEAAHRGAQEEIARATQKEFDTAEGQRAREEAAAIEQLAGEIRVRKRQTAATRKADELEAIKDLMRAGNVSMTEAQLDKAAVTFQREADARREAQKTEEAEEAAEAEAVAAEDLAKAEAKLAAGETLTPEERAVIDARDAAVAEAAEKEGKEKPPPTPEQQAIKDARYELDTFKGDVARGQRPGDYSTLQAMAESVWDSRFDKRWVPKGLWVYGADPVQEKGESFTHFQMRVKAHEKEPYHFVHSIMPKIDERVLRDKGIQQREKGARELYKKRMITVYYPEQVEPSIGWKFGRTDVPVYDSSPHRLATEVYEQWPKKYSVFPTVKVDMLVSELTQQIGVDNKTARIMAGILIYRAEKETNPSGTRGYNAAARRARRDLVGPGVPRPGTTVIEKPTVTPGKPDKTTPTATPVVETPPVVEHVPLTPEQLAALQAMLAAGNLKGASAETRENYISWITSLKEEIAAHIRNIATAVDMLPAMEREVSTRSPVDGVMTYPAPDGWPEAIINFWKVKAEGDTVINPLVKKLEPFAGTTDDVFHRAIMSNVNRAIDIYRHDLSLLERKLKDAEEAWAKGGGDHGGGGRKKGEGKGRAVVRVAPTSAGAPGYVDTGVFAPVSTEQRDTVDLVGGVRREPYTADVVLNKFESFGDKGPLEDGLPTLTRKYLISADQKETVGRAFHTFLQRQLLLNRGGAWLKSVNRSGFGCFNGTGSGKSIIMALLGKAISDWQATQPTFKRVLFVHQDGHPDAVRDAMDSLWHYGIDHRDENRFLFIPYAQMGDYAQKPGGPVKEEFAAVIFDEAQWIKAPMGQKGKTYAPDAAALKADFRAFFTATPTDAALQEEYYLNYMQQQVDTPLTLIQAQDAVRDRLGTHVSETQTSAGFMRILDNDPRRRSKYVKELTLMIEEAVANNAVTSFTLAPRLEGTVTDIREDQIAPGVATALATPQQHGEMVKRLNEHAKVEAMVERTLDLIEEGRRLGEERGIINVFEYSNLSRETEKREAYTMQGVTGGLDLDNPATYRMLKLLEERAEERKIKINVAVMTGGKGRTYRHGKNMTPSQIAKAFRAGEFNVVIMTDSMGGTGLNLDDSDGSRPKYMLIGGAGAEGQSWIQLMGRTDRKSTVSTPYAEWMAMPNSESLDHPDRKMRERIKTRVNIQRAAIGMTGAITREDIDVSKLLDQQPTFRKLVAGATPLHSSPVDVMVSERLSGGAMAAADLVADIARNETDPALAELAQALKGHPGLAGIQVKSWWGAPLPTVSADFISHPIGTQVLGYAQGRSAYVNVGSGSEAITALHEVFHHLSHQAIDDPSPRGDVLRTRLTVIMKAVPAELAPQFEGVLTSLHEFATTAHTDPEFRRVLKGIKAPSGVTLWERFKEWMKVVLGIRSRNFSALDAVLELKLTEPGTVTEHGSGDVSAQLATAMYRKIAVPQVVADIAAQAADYGDPAFRAGLATMTYDQIVDSFGKASIDPANAKKPEGHLKALYDIMEARYAYANRERHIFDKQVLQPLYKWAMDPNGGRRMIHVRLEPTGPLEEMSALQYLAIVMNESGYGKVHFGKAETDKENSILHPPKDQAKYAAKMAKKGKAERGRDRSHVIWGLHKRQFDTVLGQGGRDLYNDMADFFKEQVKQNSTLVAQHFLDTTAPRADGRKWHTMSKKEIDAEIERLGSLSNADLIDAGIQRKSLKHMKSILNPGRVPGAYFPIKRFGEWVVAVRQTVSYSNDADKDDKMDQFFGATDDPTKKELSYYVMSRFEKKSDGEAFRERIMAKFPGSKVTQVMLSSDTGVIKETNLSETLLGTFTARVNEQEGISEGDKKAQISLFTQAMLDMLPEASFADTFRPRKGVLGGSLDIFRSLNSYGSALSHYKGGAVFATPQRDALRDFQGLLYKLEHSKDADDGARARKLRTISNELGKRSHILSNAFTEQQWAQSLNNVGFAYHLVSASYNVLNMSQVPLMTAPYLAGDHGMTATASALAKAYRIGGGGPLYRLAKTGFSLTALKGVFTGEDFNRKNYDVLTEMQENLINSGNVRHAKLLSDLAQRGLIDATVAMDMSAATRTSHIDKEGNLRRQSRLGYLTDWMKMAPHITEVMNRVVTSIAAYDLEYDKQRRKGVEPAQASKIATAYAAKVVNQTQFNYQVYNKPRILQGSGTARVLLMFKQHPQHVYYFMIKRAIASSRGLMAMVRGKKLTEDEREDAKSAAKQLAYFVGMHALAAGAIGATPEPIKWLIGMLAALFGDDEPFDFELWMQNSMYDWLGPELGGIATRGLPAAAGVDLSSRVGINSLLMFEAPDPSTPDSFMADIFRVAGGPMASLLVERPYQAWSSMRNGEYTKAVEALTPKVFRDPIRAYRTATEGYTTYAGRVYSETNQIGPLEIFLTSMGLNPSSASLMYLSREVDNQVEAMQAKRTNLMKDAYFAKGDREAFNDAVTDIRRWNADNRAFQIDFGDLIKSFKNRDRNQARTHAGMLVPAKYEGWAAEKNRFRNIPRDAAIMAP